MTNCSDCSKFAITRLDCHECPRRKKNLLLFYSIKIISNYYTTKRMFFTDNRRLEKSPIASQGMSPCYRFTFFLSKNRVVVQLSKDDREGRQQWSNSFLQTPSTDIRGLSSQRPFGKSTRIHLPRTSSRATLLSDEWTRRLGFCILPGCFWKKERSPSGALLYVVFFLEDV